MTWAAVAVGAVGAGATLIQNNKAQKNASKLGKEQDRLYGIQADTATKLQPYALDFYDRSKTAYDPAAGYYRAVAGGDRSRLMSALSPELSSIGRRYGSLITASRDLNPRGGASASYNTDLAYRAGDEQQALINQERQSAYGNLAKLAGVAGTLGAGAAGTSIDAGNSAAGILSSSAGLQAALAKNTASAYGDVGYAISQMFKRGEDGKWYIGNNPGKG